MKNKLKKTNMTKFDRCARKLGLTGFILMLSALSIGIPVASALAGTNRNLADEITVIQADNQEEIHPTQIERK